MLQEEGVINKGGIDARETQTPSMKRTCTALTQQSMNPKCLVHFVS